MNNWKKFPTNAILYKNINKIDKPRKKDVHLTHLGLKYEVTIRKYNDNKGYRDQLLKETIEPTTSISNKGIPMTRLYYKEYRNLEFDIIRSPQQIKCWNRLKQSVIKSEKYSPQTKPYILKESSKNFQNSVVFKQLCHCVERGAVPLTYNHLSIMEKSTLRQTKNWIRRVKKCNKLKKTLPPLPVDFIGDAHKFYYETYNINLFDYKIRRRFDISNIPQYNYGYLKAKYLYVTHILRRSRPLVIENLPPANKDNNLFVISESHSSLINDNNTFFRRSTPPPENEYGDVNSSSRF